MYKMVYQVFKTIMVAMILVFVLDIVLYLYRAYSLNQRMESLCVSMQKVVSENNYMPEGQYNMFMTLFNDMANSFNSGYETGTDGAITQVDESALSAADARYNRFIVRQPDGNAVRLNYNQAPTGTVPVIAGVTVGSDLSRPLDYGDVAFIQAKVEVKQPVWDFVGDTYSAANFQNSNSDPSIAEKTTEFTYTFLVPCLKYQSVTN